MLRDIELLNVGGDARVVANGTHGMSSQNSHAHTRAAAREMRLPPWTVHSPHWNETREQGRR